MIGRYALPISLGVAALLAGVARADPPGFPSTPTTPAAAPAGPQAADDFAKARIAALRKFVRDKEADKKFAEHEGAERACHIDHERQLVTLTFNADGTLHCKLTELAEGYQFDIWILTVKDRFSGPGHYRVSVTPGAPLKSVPIHGTSDDVKAEIAVMSGLHEDFTDADWWCAPLHYGPYHFDSGTITIALDEAAVTQETKLTIAPLYRFNLTVLALAGPGLPSYSIADGKINENRNAADLAYYFGIHAYPFSWHRSGNSRSMPGRYFSDDYGGWLDRVSVIAGVNLSHPTEGGYLGAAVEVYGGVSITGGWQPRKYQRLQSGNAVGDMIMGTEVPTDSVWKLTGWGVGLSVDATLLKTLLSFVGR
jgi:hypothetical protein